MIFYPTTRILAWLAEYDIEPANVPDPAIVNIGAFQERQRKPLKEVLIFTHAATQLAGVIRIALIGSLTADKPNPKDADMLVTVANNADLVHLAALGRKLQGHAQSINCGGEVFLADSQNNYLGRTCPWKQCGPGIRASFDALNCGKRPFLHDDLSDIRLSKRVTPSHRLNCGPKL